MKLNGPKVTLSLKRISRPEIRYLCKNIQTTALLFFGVFPHYQQQQESTMRISNTKSDLKTIKKTLVGDNMTL